MNYKNQSERPSSNKNNQIWPDPAKSYLNWFEPNYKLETNIIKEDQNLPNPITNYQKRPILIKVDLIRPIKISKLSYKTIKSDRLRKMLLKFWLNLTEKDQKTVYIKHDSGSTNYKRPSNKDYIQLETIKGDESD